MGNQILLVLTVAHTAISETEVEVLLFLSWTGLPLSVHVAVLGAQGRRSFLSSSPCALTITGHGILQRFSYPELLSPQQH